MQSDRKRIGIWIRVSTLMQVRGETPEMHIQSATDYAAARGWKVIETYQLDGVSGSISLAHREARRMLNDVKNGWIEAVLFTRLDRFGRDAIELMKIEKQLKQHGAHLISMYERIDTSTPEGKKSFRDLANDAEYERDRQIVKVTHGILTRFKMGQILTKKAVFGYMKEGKTLVPHPEEAPVRALMYELFLDCRRFQTVARELNRRGFRMGTGNEFTNVNVKRLLQDSTAKGVYIANKTANKPGGGKIQKPRSEWIEIPVPAIVPTETWEKVQQLINSVEKPHKRTLTPYSGLLRCHCGTVMYLRKKEKKRELPKYFCRGCQSRGFKNQIRFQVLDDAIGDTFEAFMLDALPASVHIEADPESEQKGQLLGSIKAEIGKLGRKKQKLIELYQAEALSLKEFRTHHDPLVQQQQQLEHELSALEFELLEDEGREDARNKFSEAKVQNLTWQQFESQEKTEILRQFVKEITLKPNEITLHLVYMPKVLKTNELVCKGDHTDGHVK